MSAPEMWVIICVLNGARVITEQLDALAAQATSREFEILVVDNGSSDDTTDVVERWAAVQGRTRPRLRLIRAGGPPGISRVRNIGVLHARGRILAFCDADDVVGPRWVDSFCEAVRPDIIVGGPLRWRRQDGSLIEGLELDTLPRSLGREFVNGGNLSIERETLIRLGGFDESLPRYGWEDVDLCWRAVEQSVALVLVDEAELTCTISTGTASLAKSWRIGRGTAVMVSRFPDAEFGGWSVRVAGVVAARSVLCAVLWSLRRRSWDRDRAWHAAGATGRLVEQCRALVVGSTPRKLALLGTDVRTGA